MTQLHIAHIREQGQDMIIVPLDSSFRFKSREEQNEAINSLQICAQNAGLAGRVVVCWSNGGQYQFIAPNQWHAFFKSISWDFIMANRNKVLTCS